MKNDDKCQKSPIIINTADLTPENLTARIRTNLQGILIDELIRPHVREIEYAFAIGEMQSDEDSGRSQISDLSFGVSFILED